MAQQLLRTARHLRRVVPSVNATAALLTPTRGAAGTPLPAEIPASNEDSYKWLETSKGRKDVTVRYTRIYTQCKREQYASHTQLQRLQIWTQYYDTTSLSLVHTDD